jgi:hypothetical protein
MTGRCSVPSHHLRSHRIAEQRRCPYGRFPSLLFLADGRALEFLEVFGDEQFAGEVLFHIGHPRGVIVI